MLIFPLRLQLPEKRSFGYYKLLTYAKSADLSKNGLKMSFLYPYFEMTQKCSFRYYKSSNYAKSADLR